MSVGDLGRALTNLKLSKPGTTGGAGGSSGSSRLRRPGHVISRNKDAIEPLLQTLKNKPKFTKMVEYAVVCLKNMAVDVVSAEELVEEGVIEVLMNVMRMNPHNEAILALIHDTLNTICRNEELTRAVAERIDPQLIIHSLSKNTTQDAMSSCATFMAKLMAVPDLAQAYYAQHQVVPALARATQAFKDDPLILTSLADCATSIAHLSAEAASAVAQTGVTGNLVEALKGFPGNERFVQSSLGYLGYVASRSPESAAAIKEMGVVDAIVAALEANPVQTKILDEGAKTLKTVSSSFDLINALRHSPTELTPELASAVATLASMLLVDENIPPFVEAKGIEWLIQAIKTASQHTPEQEDIALRILRSGPRALMRVAADEKKIYAIMASQGVPLLTGVATSHGKDETVLVAVYNCLSKMITRKENADYLFKHKLLEMLDRDLQLHKYSPSLCVPAAYMIQRFAQHPTLHESLVAKQTPHKLVRGLEVQAAAAAAAAQAVEATGERARSASISSTGGSPTSRSASGSVSSVMAEAIASASAAEACLSATAQILESCRVLATSATGAAALVEAGLVNEVSTILKQLSKDEAVCIAAVRALDALQASIGLTSGASSAAVAASVTSGGPAPASGAVVQAAKQQLIAAMKNTRLEESIVKVLDLHAESPELQEVGQRILQGTAEVDTAGNATTRVMELANRMLAQPLAAETHVPDLDEAIRVINSLVKLPENVTKLMKKDVHLALIKASEAASALPILVPQAPAEAAPVLQQQAPISPPPLQKSGTQRRLGVLQAPPTATLQPATSPVGSVALALPVGQHAVPSDKLRQRESLFEALSEALVHFAKVDKAIAAQFASHNVLGNLMQVALKYVDAPAIAEHAMELTHLCVQQVEHVPALVQSGVINDVIMVAQQHKTNELVQSAASRSLVELCSDAGTASKVVSSGGASVVVAALQTNFYDSAESARVLEVVHKISLVPEASAAMLNAGGLDAVLAILRKHEDQPEIVQSCMRALVSLLVDEPTANEMAQKGVVEHAAKAIRTHYKNPVLIEAAVVLLGSLSTSRQSLERLAAPQLAAGDLLTWAASKLKDNSLVVEAAETARTQIIKFREAEEKRKEAEAARARAAAESARVAKENSRYEMLDINLENPASVQDFMQGMKNANKNQLKILMEKLGGVASAQLTPEALSVAVENGLLTEFANIIRKSTEEDDAEIMASALNPFLRLSETLGGKTLEALSADPAFLQAHLDVALDGRRRSTLGGQARVVQSSVDIARSLGTLANMPVNDHLLASVNNRDALPALYDLMVKSSEPAVMTHAAKLLGKLSNDEGAASSLAKLSTIRELIDALRNNISNAEFVRYGLYLLGNLAISSELKEEIGVQGGILLIKQAISMHQTNVPLVSNALYSLAALTYDHPTNSTFVSASSNYLQLILTLISNNAGNTDLLESALCVCANVATLNDANKLTIIQNAGLSLAVDVVLSHYDNHDLQATALRLIETLVYDTNSADLAVRTGCIQATVSITAQADPQILSGIVPVLERIVSFIPLDDHLPVFLDEGVIPALLAMSEEHPMELELQHRISRVLCNLAVSSVLAESIVKQGGTEVILNTLRNLGYVHHFAEICMRLLYNLTFSFPNMAHMLTVGVTREIVQALKSNTQGVAAAAAAAQAAGAPFEPLLDAESPNAGAEVELAFTANSSNPILLTGLRCLSNLCYSEDACLRTVSDGALDLIADLIVTRGHIDPALLLECVLVLANMCRPEAAALTMLEKTAVALGNWCNAAAPADADIQVARGVMRYLGNVFVHSSAALVAINKFKTELIVPIVQLLCRADRVTIIGEVIAACAKPLENLAYASQNVRDALAAPDVGAVEILEFAHSRWASPRPDVGQAIEQALNAIRHKPFKLSAIDLEELLNDRSDTIRQVVVQKPAAHEAKGESESYEIPANIRNFLTAGAMLMKHSRTAMPHPRHVFVTDDLRWLVWKDPKTKVIEDDTKMKIFQIRSVERGRCTEQLQRQRFGKYLADEKCCFSIQGRERTVDLEATSEKERERWVQAIEALIAYRKSLQAAHSRQSAFM